MHSDVNGPGENFSAGAVMAVGFGSMARVEETGFAQWLRTQMLERGYAHPDGRPNESKFARYMSKDGEKAIRPATVNRWFTVGSIPGPDMCQRIAVALRLPTDTVLAAAGHRPAEERPEASPLPEWVGLILSLPAEDRELVERFVRKLAAVSVGPQAGQEGPR